MPYDRTELSSEAPLFVFVAAAGFFRSAAIPVLYELAAEVAYPLCTGPSSIYIYI